MQAIMETIFNIFYLSTVLTIGIIMIRSSQNNKSYKLFGIMSIILGVGDAFHLIPRSYALFTTGLEANAAALGVGKLVTSITMTIFYIILYIIWRMRYQITDKKSVSWGIYLH